MIIAGARPGSSVGGARYLHRRLGNGTPYCFCCLALAPFWRSEWRGPRCGRGRSRSAYLTLLGQTGRALEPRSSTALASCRGLAWLPFVALGVLSIPSVRRSLVIVPVYGMVQKILPKVSDTEAQALEAGTVGFDAEIFSGTPDWDKLQSIPPIELSAEEQAFLDGPTHELCAMINDWQIRHAAARDPRGDLGFRQESTASSAC